MKSPIELQGDANLTLVVDGTFTVTGGKAGDGPDAQASYLGGAAGRAGISVPNGTTLVLRGSGTLNAYGGDAGRGGNGGARNGYADNGAPGGGGAGAGIGGNGGSGGNGGYRLKGENYASDAKTNGTQGGTGVSAGNIYLYEAIRVNAFGGAGGAGGWDDVSCPGGGGGYPGAGIGGGGAGGAGGSHGPGGGGFSGGGGDGGTDKYSAVNGNGGIASSHHGGGGYFSYFRKGSESFSVPNNIGGIAAVYGPTSSWKNTWACNGGSAGSGGEVKKANTATLDARNGSYLTANQRKWGQSPTPIYLQSGFKLDMIRGKGVSSVSARTGADLTQELKNKNVTQSMQPFSYDGKDIYGVGSGAGATETSNGSC